MRVLSKASASLKSRWRMWVQTSSRAERVGCGLLVLFLLARLGLANIAYEYPDRITFTWDTRYYLELAQNLLDQGTFDAPSYPEQSLVRTPGYPVFLALVFGLFGPKVGHVVLIQLLITIGTCALTYAVGVRLGNRKTGLLAAWVYALNPNSLFWALTVLSETVFTFVLMLAVYESLVYYQEGNRRRIVTIGLLLGLVTLLRPIGLLLIPIWALAFMFWSLKSEIRFKTAASHSFLLILIGASLVLPWFVRNFQKHGKFTLGTSGSVTFRAYHIAMTYAAVKEIPVEEARIEMAALPDQSSIARDMILGHPGIFLREQAYGVAKTAVGIEHGFWMQVFWGRTPQPFGLLTHLLRGDLSGFLESLGQFGENGDDRLNTVLILFAMAYTLLMYILVVIGLVRLFRRGLPLRSWIVLMGITMLYIVAMPGARGASRFRVPVDPLLAVFAGLSVIGSDDPEMKKT